MITELKINGKPTNLIVVEVPINAINPGWLYDCFTVDIPNEDGTVKYRWISEVDDYLHSMDKKHSLNPIGEVAKDKIEFDVEPYVEKLNGGYADYVNGGNVLKEKTINKEESFYSLLASNGLYFENPMEEPVDDENISYHNYLYSKEQWAYYENKLVKGKLLIIEKL